MTRAAFVIFMLFMVIGLAPAYSATIEAKRGGVIEIKGPIEFGDFDKFSAKLGAFPDSKTVSLISPGGRVRDAVQIGRLLRLFEMGTVVPKGQVCVSSCVFIWAAGIWRELDPGANLYMHCVFAANDVKAAKDVKKTDLKTSKCSEKTNELLVRYLALVEMPQEAIPCAAKSRRSAGGFASNREGWASCQRHYREYSRDFQEE
jgi:hypothetical protein